VTPHESAGIDLKIDHGFRQREIKVQPQNRGKIPWLRLDATINANKEPGDGVFKGSVPPLQHDQDWAQRHPQAGEYVAPELGCAETIPADGSFVRNGLVYSAAELILNGWPTPPVPFRLISTQSL
jgi:hypothetical protein